MQPEVTIAVIAFVGTVITSLVGAYIAARNEASKSSVALRKEVDEIRIGLAVTTSKVDTLWEIYAEDAIRQARATGMVASRSPLAPTDAWQNKLPKDVSYRIEHDAVLLSETLGSPYDIAIELWSRYKKELVGRSETESIRSIWGTMLVISINAVLAKASEEKK